MDDETRKKMNVEETFAAIEKRILVLSGDQAEGTKDDGQF